MRFWTSMSLDRCNSLIFVSVLVTIAGCARFGKPEPVPVTGIDGASLANAHAFAPDIPPLPSGYLDVDAYIEDGLLAPMRNPDTIPAGVTVDYGVVYGRVDGYDLVLDLYRPENLEQPAPALVFIHGGGWSRHGRDYYAYWASRYAAKGYVCASIDYRISDEAPFPAAVEDAKCAVRWMRATAAKLRVDADRIAGRSVGRRSSRTHGRVFAGRAGIGGYRRPRRHKQPRSCGREFLWSSRLDGAAGVASKGSEAIHGPEFTT